MVDHLDALRRDGDALMHAAGRNLAAPVPTCPGWSVMDLLAHLLRVYSYAARQARSESRLPGDDTELAPEAVPAALADAHAELLLVLSELDPDAPAWNSLPDAPDLAGYWRRRMAVETAVHRWDVENAVREDGGAPPAIEPALACDGIDEALTQLLPRRRRSAGDGIDGTAHLHVTDAPDGSPAEWTLRLLPDGAVHVRRQHEKADAALRGSAGEVLLAVWGRPADVERFGERRRHRGSASARSRTGGPEHGQAASRRSTASSTRLRQRFPPGSLLICCEASPVSSAV